MTKLVDETLQFIPKFDDDGLMPALAIESETGAPLMMAYVNRAALQKSLETGYAHFWSRSRSRFWQKGETSGNRLKILEIRVDCDQDSLVMMVEMERVKAACHTGRKTCYYRKLTLLDPSNPQNITLESTGETPLFDPKEVYEK